ncbi:MAG: OmpA family protein [Deltaproteobacteria bacterium]|nr:OmpA family protein [Deltaproteobacteria bacterium]MBW2692137.1 OmpA family protein [Deltaproteobacteria bacterium]
MQSAVADAQRYWIPRFSRPLAACLLLPIAFGCVTKGTYDEVVGERDRLAVARRDLENNVEKLTAANQSLITERLALIDENEDFRISTEKNERKVASLTRVKSQLTSSLETTEALLVIRSAEIENIRSSYDGLISDLEDEVASGQIHIEQLRSGLRLNLSEEILFPSGSAALNSGGQAVLTKVSRRLVELPHTIAVEGHTDDVPVARRYPSNWELAAARASSVVRLMIEQGVEPERIKVVSRAEFEPIASNETKEGRAKNRRIEIQLDAPINDPDETSGTEEPPAEADTSASPPTDAEGPPAP